MTAANAIGNANADADAIDVNFVTSDVDGTAVVDIDANNATGTAVELIWEAIDDALRAGDAELRRSHFERAYRDRVSCPQSRNPFVVDNWIEIDPTQILDRGRIEDPTGRNTMGKASRKGSGK